MRNRWLSVLCCGALLLTSGCTWPAFFSSGIALGGDKASPAAPASSTAVTVADKAHSATPPEAVGLIERARALWDGDVCTDPEKAIAALDAALKLAPDDAGVYLWRGRALSDGGYLADAFDDLTRSIRLQPTALAYAARGLAGLRLGNVEGADQDLSHALSLDDEEPRVYVYRAALLFLQGEDKKACADLTVACHYGQCGPQDDARREKLCH